MKPIIVTKKEFLEFIQQQPDDRPLDFLENRKTSGCGCPMVHYGQSKKMDFTRAGMTAWTQSKTVFTDFKVVAEFESGFHFGQFCASYIHNYGELKKLLKIV